MTLDYLWISAPEFLDIIDSLYKDGVSTFCFDEVHHLKDWAALLKNVYDCYPDVSISYSGSSLLKLDSRMGDLSRRQLAYELTGLSFREYLSFEGIKNIESVGLADVLKSHREIAAEVTRGIKILPLFRKYLESGYYPFYKEEGDGYFSRIQEVISQTIDMDIPAVEDVEFGTLQKLKKLLMILAVQVPFIPKMNELYQQLDTNREHGLKLLNLLEQAKLITMLKTPAKALKHISAPEKLYLDNTNMMYALSDNVEMGTVRETFFMNQLSMSHEDSLPLKGDFRIDGKYLFEVGGKKKSFGQIKDEKDSFLAIDSIEIGNGNRIPLWLFGFLD